MAGLPLDTELELAAPAGPEPDPAPEAATAVKAALAHNPEIESRCASGGKGPRRRKGRPGRIHSRNRSVCAVHSQNGAPFVSPNNGVVGLHMTWTVFEFGKRRGQVSERQAEVAQAEENLASGSAIAFKSMSKKRFAN